jgi:hypothetical protein
MTTKRTNPRKDFTQVAFGIVQQATGDAPPAPAVDPKKKAAIESGRKGGFKGGTTRAKKLTAEERSEIAKKAAEARWGKS